MKLRTTLLTSFLGFSGFVSAEQIKENVNVNVDVDNGQGKVVIIKDVDGQTQTIEKSFTADDNMDIDAMVEEILADHGIDHSGDQVHKKVIKLINDSDKDFVWIKKNDDISVDLNDGHANVIIKKDNNGIVEVIRESFDLADGEDINVFIDELMQQHGIEPGDAEIHRKVITLDRTMTHIKDDKPRMGFMANVQDEGWEIVSVVPESGAAEAGMIKGDVVISIDGQSTDKTGLGLTEFITMDQQQGQFSEVIVMRDGEELILEVEAKVLDSPDIVMELDGNHKWFSSSNKDFKFKTGDLDGMFEGLHVDVAHLDKMVEGLGDHDIRVVTTGDADAYFFSGSKMNQWLGKKHHFSTVTETLGQYFGTSEGVLVLEVDQNNKLGLKDGDVIQAINGVDVKSPKDVVRIMSGFKSDSNVEIEIIRNKETIYLES